MLPNNIHIGDFVVYENDTFTGIGPVSDVCSSFIRQQLEDDDAFFVGPFFWRIQDGKCDKVEGESYVRRSQVTHFKLTKDEVIAEYFDLLI